MEPDFKEKSVVKKLISVPFPCCAFKRSVWILIIAIYSSV